MFVCLFVCLFVYLSSLFLCEVFVVVEKESWGFRAIVHFLFSSQDWLGKAKKVHVGVKPAFELYPSELIQRRRKERAEAFALQQRNCIRDLQSKVSSNGISFLQFPLPLSLFPFLPFFSICFFYLNLLTLFSPLSFFLTGNSDENSILLKELSDLFAAKNTDYGDLLDVITWFDGGVWWAMVALEGKMKEAKRIRSFKVCIYIHIPPCL